MDFCCSVVDLECRTEAVQELCLYSWESIRCILDLSLEINDSEEERGERKARPWYIAHRATANYAVTQSQQDSSLDHLSLMC